MNQVDGKKEIHEPETPSAEQSAQSLNTVPATTLQGVIPSQAHLLWTLALAAASAHQTLGYLFPGSELPKSMHLPLTQPLLPHTLESPSISNAISDANVTQAIAASVNPIAAKYENPSHKSGVDTQKKSPIHGANDSVGRLQVASSLAEGDVEQMNMRLDKDLPTKRLRCSDRTAKSEGLTVQSLSASTASEKMVVETSEASNGAVSTHVRRNPLIDCAHPHISLHCSNDKFDEYHGIHLVVNQQPPPEVRTSTKSDKKSFSVVVSVVSHSQELKQVFFWMKAELMYAPVTASGIPQPIMNGDRLLQGNLMVPVNWNGCANFVFSIFESSAKHLHREFILFVTLLAADRTTPIATTITNSFYTYSHTTVLHRRKNITLKTLSYTYGPASGGVVMHVIGSPFVQSPSLSVLFTTPHGEVKTQVTELFNECVAFFMLPPCPGERPLCCEQIEAYVQVTNDGRNYSDPLIFTYIVGNESDILLPPPTHHTGCGHSCTNTMTQHQHQHSNLQQNQHQHQQHQHPNLQQHQHQSHVLESAFPTFHDSPPTFNGSEYIADSPPPSSTDTTPPNSALRKS